MTVGATTGTFGETRMGEKGAQWLVTLARLGCTSATSVPLFSHPERYLVTLFGAFSLCTVGAFLAIFPLFLGFVEIYGGTPRFISPILGLF